ncbi:hypothetical protein [Kistimonas asteriae]|uniref:hypothetical protein n=1 Tax=Kistimonas asteriae TaxID=517724 RepID=UPI001BA6399A|nr:hypothetical protein [Kistimonas asteriae]
MKINIEEDIKTNNREVEVAATFINTNQTQIEVETLQELSEKTMKAMEIDSSIRVSLLPLAEALDMAIVINISLIQA